MHSDSRIDDVGYSPLISAELHLHGKRFVLSAMGPAFLTIHTTDSAPAGLGTIHLYINGVLSTSEVELPEGVAPDRKHHVCRSPLAVPSDSLVA